MITRNKAAKTVDLVPKNRQILREEDDSINLADSGISSCETVSSTSASQSEISKNHRQNNSKKKSAQPTASSSQENSSNVDKKNNGNLANGQQIGPQGRKSKVSSVGKSVKNDALFENGRKRGQKMPSTEKATQKTLSKTMATQSAEESEGESVVEEEIKLSQCGSDCDWIDRLKWLQSRRDVGLWIQCCRENCRKWRFTDAINDPVDVPEIWYCAMQLDPWVAYCDYPQQKIPSHILEDLIENKYNAGSIVWAYLQGYPWWPAMVDDCPITFRYYDLEKSSRTPIKYNVTYFTEDKIQCSWISERNLQPYKWNPKEVFLKHKRMTYRGISYKDQVLRACVIADKALKLPLRERLEKFSYVARFTENTQTEIPTRSTGSHNRTCPVMLRRSVAGQQGLCDDNLTILNETPSTSRMYSQTSVRSQEKTERGSKVASNKWPKTSNDKNSSSFGTNLQISAESQKSIQKFPQVVSDNTRPKRLIPNEATARETAATCRIYSQTVAQSQEETERTSEVVLNIKDRNIVRIFDGETSNHKNASAFGKYSQISAERPKGIQKFAEVASDNTRQRSKIVTGDEASSESNSRGIYSQTSFDSQNDNGRPLQVLWNNASPGLNKFSFGDESFGSTSHQDPREIERFPQLVTNNGSSRIKRVSFDELLLQFSGLISGVHQETNVERRRAMKRCLPVDSKNRSPRVEKYENSNSQSFPYLNSILQNLKSKKTRFAQ